MRVYASQQTFHSIGLRAICLGLSHWSEFAPFCFARVSFRVCQANASRPACMTSRCSSWHLRLHSCPVWVNNQNKCEEVSEPWNVFFTAKLKEVRQAGVTHSLCRHEKILSHNNKAWLSTSGSNQDKSLWDHYVASLLRFVHTLRVVAAEIDFCRGWDPRPSASVNQRQTGWGPHQRWWSDDACAALQRRPRHELSWIWSDFLSEHVWLRASRRAAGSRRGRRAGGNDSLHDVRARLKIILQ